MANGYRLEWVDVSRSNLCPKCNKDDWCRVTKGGEYCACRRTNDGTGKEKTDKSGDTYWLYSLNGHANGRSNEPCYSHTDNGGKLADAEVRHKVYSALLSEMTIGAKHLRALAERGLDSPEQSTLKIASILGYRTLGRDRIRAVDRLIESGLEKSFPGVPGLFVKEGENGRRWWTLAGGGGMLMLIRDLKKRIVALLVRLDEAKGGGKYRYLSSKKRGGAGPGSPVHIPLVRPADTITVRVTEGALKADVATILSEVLTIGLPGVNSWRRAARMLRQLGAKTARLAFDADWRTNPHVAAALVQLARSLARNKFQVEVETWNIADGKGIDDLLAAGKAPEIITGDAATALIDEIAAANKPASTAGGRPKMDADQEDLSCVTPEAINHVEAANRPPHLFRYGSCPSRLEIDTDGLPVMRPMDVTRMRHELARAIYWYRWKKVGDGMEEVNAYPPKIVVEDVLATPALPFPVLRRIIECPAFAADGTLHDQPGYNPASQTYYLPANGFVSPAVPQNPTDKEISALSAKTLSVR